MKKIAPMGLPLSARLKKLLLIMKLSIFLVVFTFFQTLAGTVSSQTSGLTLNVKQTKVEDILLQIENQSNYVFLYNKDLIDVKQITSISVNGAKVEKVLDLLFEGSNINYKLMGRQIVLSPAFAQQQKKVTGKVTDINGDPIPGVTVSVKGTTNGTITSSEGTYEISKVEENSTLMFSFVGMQNQDFSTAGKSVIDVILKEDKVAIDEVIVVGYGTSTRKEFTGSVSSVKMEDSPISLLPNTNALESLKGNVAGLNIGASNSAGGEPDMIIRGQNSISGSNDPLIILDGVIYLGALNDINPNDIATVDVLKDAVSASVYGSRSANGVISITTKRGKSGKPVISFNVSSGVQTWQNKPNIMKGEQWISVVNARNGYAEGSTDWMKTGELANLAAGTEVNWIDEVTQIGVVQDYQMSVSGASKGTNYYLSTSYNNNKGVVIGDEFNRISVLGKIDTDITSWLKVGVDGSYSNRDYSGYNANLGTAQTMSPYGVLYHDDNGNLEKYPYEQSGINPLWGVSDGTRENVDKRQNFRLNTNAVVSIPWIKGLSFRLNYLMNLDKNQSGDFTYEDYYVGEGSGLTRYEASVVQGFLAKANGNIQNTTTNSYVFDNILNYKNKFGKHNIDVTAVATRDYKNYESINTTGSDFAANGNTLLGMWGLHYATTQKVDLDATLRTNIGYLGRFNYSYNDKYYLTSSYRHDGASVFGSSTKWGNFAAVGLAWRITGEEFMKAIKPLDNMKLKLAWGQNGNQGISPYATLSQVANGSSGGYRYEFSDAQGTIEYGLVQTTLGNYGLGWEKTASWNTGFESAWLNNRLFVDVDIYASQTTDQLFTRDIPVMTGFKTIKTSLGQVDNSGIELTIRSVNIDKKDLRWTTSVTYWKNNNKLVKVDGTDTNGDGIEDDDITSGLFIGKSLGTIYGYKQDGLVQDDDTEYRALTSASPGAPKYFDLDSIAGIGTGDRTFLGDNKENFRLNLSNTVKFKNLEFYMLVSGIFGGNGKYLQSNSNAYMTSGTGTFNANMTYKPYWTSENPNNVYPNATFSGDSRFLGLQSRGFVRIQDISLSYTFNQQWVKSANISAFKVFFTAKNVATFTNWDGGDPETGTTYLSSTLPVVSTYSFGASISF